MVNLKITPTSNYALDINSKKIDPIRSLKSWIPKIPKAQHIKDLKFKY